MYYQGIKKMALVGLQIDNVQNKYDIEVEPIPFFNELHVLYGCNGGCSTR